jgi:hypothetical protein
LIVRNGQSDRSGHRGQIDRIDWINKTALTVRTDRKDQIDRTDQTDRIDQTGLDTTSSGRKAMQIKERGQASPRRAPVPNCTCSRHFNIQTTPPI